MTLQDCINIPGKLVLNTNNMESQKDIQDFIAQWKEKFPGVKPPDLCFKGIEDIEEKLGTCKNLIKNLEEKLNQEKFLLIFLQTYLAATKKSYNRERWGYNNSPTDAVQETDEDINSSHLEDTENMNSISAVDENEHKAFGSTVHIADEGTKAVVNKPLVKIRQKEDAKKSGVNRLSKVLANVKLFEAKADTKDSAENVSENTATFPPRASARKRTSYLEVWECKTGAEKEQKPMEEDTNLQSDDKLENAALAMASAKPQPSQRGPRKDYVEVWTCNTGDQVSVGVVYDDQKDTVNDSQYPYGEDMDDTQDYDVDDIDMKHEYGKRHYTIAGSDIKLRKNPSMNDDPSNNRLTWPAAGAPYQDDALKGEFESHLEDNVDDYSASIDLSDLENDHLSDSQQSERSDEDSMGSFPEQAHSHGERLNVGQEVSPLHRLRRAQTTNERMSVAYSAYTEWSDDEQGTPDRTSILSGPSSDDGGHASEEDILTAPVKSTATPIFVFSRPKSCDMDAQSDDSLISDNRKSVISEVVDGNVPEVYGSPKGETVSDMVDYHKVRSIAEAEKLRMRKWVLTSLLDNEEAYLDYLNTLLLYMKPLKATIGTSQPVMSAQDFDTLFYRVIELHNLHAVFYDKLKPRIDVWSADTKVGDLFKMLLGKLNYYADYLNNYKRAQHTVEKCAKENTQFAVIIENMKVQARGTKNAESINLIDVLYKPVERVMRTTLVLQDLLKHTPHRHPDYQILRQVLKQSQQFLERLNSSSSSYKSRRIPSSAVAAARSADREMIKDGFLVEVASDGTRKLRHCFLYSDLLLCAKQKNSAGVFHSKDSYECKWYIPLADLSFQPQEDSETMPEMPSTSEDELRVMSSRAQQLKRDIARERKRNKKAQKSSDGSPVKSRQEERLRKKLAELEARIVLAAPDLPLRIYHMQGKSYMFLMSSDYERIEWSDAIMKQQESCFKSFSLTSYEINSLLGTCVRHRKVNNIGSMLMNEDEELLSGYLNVTIHSGKGFLRACNPYCTLEVDSYGQFQTKAKTRSCRDTKEPVWDEEFEIDLDGAMTLRILCYDRAREASAGASYDDDVLIAKGKVGLIQESLRDKGEWVEESVLMNELTIRVSVKFIERERSLQRLQSKKSNGVFGVKIETSAKRESSGIPGIVRKCVAEIERRGMNEIGIYRVSGVASEIQALKASFDTDRKDVNTLLSEVDVNAVAGVLKLYFRELPEPLFTDSRYGDFVDASTLTDPDTKRRTIVRLLSDLPPANYKTLHFLRKHLVNVANNETVNKMSMHNLATVFGPTLLRPAEEKAKPADQSITHNALMLNALRLDVHYQMDVLLYCLELDEMMDYETMKNASKNGTKPNNEKHLSRSFDNLSIDQPNAEEPFKKDSNRPESVAAPVKQKSQSEVSSSTVVSPPQHHQRYHPYEEIFIPPKLNAKPQIVKPTVARKPSSDLNSQGKPKPAPRRPVAAKSQMPVVTDL